MRTPTTPRTRSVVRSLVVGSVAQILLLIGAAAINLVTQDWRNPVPYIVAVSAAVAAAIATVIRSESVRATSGVVPAAEAVLEAQYSQLLPSRSRLKHERRRRSSALAIGVGVVLLLIVCGLP